MCRKSPRESLERLKKKLNKPDDREALAEIEELVYDADDKFRVSVTGVDGNIMERFEDESEAAAYIEANGGTMSVTRMR